MRQEGRTASQRLSEQNHTAEGSRYVFAYHSHSRVIEKSGSLLCDLPLDELTQSRTLDWSIRPGLALECRWIARTPLLKGKGDPFLMVLKKTSSKALYPYFGFSGAAWCESLTRLDLCHHLKRMARTGCLQRQTKTWYHTSICPKVFYSEDFLEHTVSKFDQNGGLSTTKPLSCREQRTNHQHRCTTNINKPVFCTHRTFSAFGLLGNKGMHCYNGNCKLHHLEKWYHLVIAIDEEGYAPRSYVQDNLNYVWKDLISLHKTKNSSRPLDVLSAKSHVLEITDFVLHSYKETVGHQQRQALDNNMEHMIVMIFLLKEEHPDWFDPIEDEVLKPVEYKVHYIDRIIAIKSALPPRKRKSRNCTSNGAAQEIERNLKIVNAKMELIYKWWTKSLAHPPLLKNHLVLGRHRALMRNPSAKTSVLAVHDEAKVVATPTPQPQEDDMTINPTIQPQIPPCKGLFELGRPQISQQRHHGNHKTLSAKGKSLLKSIVNGTDRGPW